MSTNFFKDNKDLQYYYEKGVDWEKLVGLSEVEYKLKDGHASYEDAREFFVEILTMFGEFVAKEVNPHVPAFDEAKVKLIDGEAVSCDEWNKVFRQIGELGIHSMPIPREFGGMNAPLLLFHFNNEMLARADVSAMTHMSFHSGIALAMLVYSFHEGSTEFDVNEMMISKSRFADAVSEIATGEAWGAMDITEPDAGSDMAMLKTRAVQNDKGEWHLTGSKIFISSGHGKYHIVIARTEDDLSLGLDGLSLFMVKAYDDNADGTRTRHINIVRVEEKLGHNGSATCALEFDNSPGVLFGERGEGFKLMLLLMNNARVGVGFECLGLMECAWRMAVGYAAERGSMGKTIDRHEMIADYLDEMELDIAAQRAMTMHAGFHEEYAQKLLMFAKPMLRNGKPLPTLGLHTMDDVDRGLAHHRWESRRMTPLLKYFGGERSVALAQRNIQIHGGVGYTKDYGAEKLLRDAMVLPIYEGTSQIQSLMAMKDNLGRVLSNPQAFVTQLAQIKWRSVSAQDPLERRVAKLRATSMATVQSLLQRTATDKFREIRHLPFGQWKSAFVQMDPKRDFSFAMLHAERLTRILIDATVAELFFDQYTKHPEREDLLVRWLEKAEPRTKMLVDEIATTGERILRKLAASEDQAAE